LGHNDKKEATMAEIKTYPLVRHFRAEPTSHVLRYRRGRLVGEGPGLAFWFSPVSTQAAEIPRDDQELPFLFHARSADFQQLTVQGVITHRFADPGLLARRVDFTLDLTHGGWTETPLEQVGGLLTQIAQQYVIDELVRVDLRAILAGGVAPIRDRIAGGLRAEASLGEMGVEIVAVRVASVAPAAEVEKALQQPTREAIQQLSDEATFARRAQAVDKERAIGENELANQIELAKREEALVVQRGANDRRRAEEQAAARAITAQAGDDEARLIARRETDGLRALEEVRLAAERERGDLQAGLGAPILLALALRELAGQIGKIDHLTLTPDLITPLLSRLSAPGGQG
jgi:regulator of protease activity HflC (stomatin/prohibitin superfamily)